jgi:hypothetical protein
MLRMATKLGTVLYARPVPDHLVATPGDLAEIMHQTTGVRPSKVELAHGDEQGSGRIVLASSWECEFSLPSDPVLRLQSDD